MKNYAIVIGINCYEDRGNWPDLRTPVPDALRAIEWLRTAAPVGGGVDPDNLLLLLGTRAAGPDLAVLAAQAGISTAVVEGVVRRGATLLDIRRAAGDLAARVASDGSARLFFVYCGHGAQYQLAIDTVDAIAPADIEANLIDPLSVPGITQFFRELPIPEQFFIFDCCRNLFRGRTQPATLVPPSPGASARCDQYIIYATANGAVARDAPPSVLATVLQGLRGFGRAKLWDTGLQRHVVRFNQLFDHVRQQFLADPIQTPRQSGENSGLNPALAEPPVPQTQLRLAFRPDAPALAAIRAQVSLTWWDGRMRLPNLPVSVSPVAVPLYPGTYDIQVFVPPPSAAPARSAAVEIGDEGLDWGYDFTAGAVVRPAVPAVVPPVPPAPAPVRPPGERSGPPEPPAPPVPMPGVGPGLTPAPFVPDSGFAPVAFSAPAAVRAPADALSVVAGAAAGAILSSDWEALPAGPLSFGGPGGRPRLTVRADDRLAVLELLDTSSAEVRVGGGPLLGMGELVFDGPPGAYRARWVVPGGSPAVESIIWRGTADQTVTVPAPPPRPSPLLTALLTRFGGDPRRGLTEVSELIGGALFPGVSPLLALASAANKATGVWAHEHGDRLRGLGLARTPLGKATAGRAELLLAIEPGGAEDRPDAALAPDEFLSRVEVRLSDLEETDEPAGPALAVEPANNAAGIATVNLPGKLGMRWVWVRSPDGAAGAFALPVLRGRTSQLVLSRRNDGRVRAFLFCPTASTGPDPIRQLDLAQRFLAEGGLRYALLCLDSLLDGSDPVAGCLGGHLLIRLREVERLGELARRMAHKFPVLPDSHVLVGRHHELSDRPDEARTAYEAALEHGVPVLAQHLERLWRGVRRLRIEHPRAILLGRVAGHLLPGVVWTGWLPTYRASDPPETEAFSAPLAFAGGPPVSSPPGETPMPTALTVAPPPDKPPPSPFAAFGSMPGGATAPGGPVAPRRCLCSNQANGGPLLSARPETQSLRTRAVADFTLRWAPGSTINVGFMNSYPAVESAVRKYAVEWTQFANLTFQFVTASAHLAVNMSPTATIPVGTFNSFLGRDCHKYFALGYPSMNLVFGNVLPDDREVRRLVLHEFGHAISLAHEHMSPVRDLEWNWAALRTRFNQYGWNDAMIQAQIVDVYQPAGSDVRATAFDINSVMMYNFDAGTALYKGTGQPFVSPVNSDLSPRDKVMANMLYPAASAADLPEQPLTPDTPKSGTIADGGQVAKYVFAVTAGTKYVLETGGSMPTFLSLLNYRNDPTGMWVEENGPIWFTPDTTGNMYAEVRHTSPLSGTGDFTITLRLV